MLPIYKHLHIFLALLQLVLSAPRYEYREGAVKDIMVPNQKLKDEWYRGPAGSQNANGQFNGFVNDNTGNKAGNNLPNKQPIMEGVPPVDEQKTAGSINPQIENINVLNGPNKIPTSSGRPLVGKLNLNQPEGVISTSSKSPMADNHDDGKAMQGPDRGVSTSSAVPAINNNVQVNNPLNNNDELDNSLNQGPQAENHVKDRYVFGPGPDAPQAFLDESEEFVDHVPQKDGYDFLGGDRGQKDFKDGEGEVVVEGPYPAPPNTEEPSNDMDPEDGQAYPSQEETFENYPMYGAGKRRLLSLEPNEGPLMSHILKSLMRMKRDSPGYWGSPYIENEETGGEGTINGESENDAEGEGETYGESENGTEGEGNTDGESENEMEEDRPPVVVDMMKPDEPSSTLNDNPDADPSQSYDPYHNDVFSEENSIEDGGVTEGTIGDDDDGSFSLESDTLEGLFSDENESSSDSGEDDGKAEGDFSSSDALNSEELGGNDQPSGLDESDLTSDCDEEMPEIFEGVMWDRGNETDGGSGGSGGEGSGGSGAEGSGGSGDGEVIVLEEIYEPSGDGEDKIAGSGEEEKEKEMEAVLEQIILPGILPEQGTQHGGPGEKGPPGFANKPGSQNKDYCTEKYMKNSLISRLCELRALYNEGN